MTGDKSLANSVTQAIGIDLSVGMEDIMAIYSSSRETELKAKARKLRDSIRDVEKMQIDEMKALMKEGERYLERAVNLEAFRRECKELGLALEVGTSRVEVGNFKEVVQTDLDNAVEFNFEITVKSKAMAWRVDSDTADRSVVFYGDDKIATHFWNIQDQKDILSDYKRDLMEVTKAMGDLPSLERQARATVARANLESTEAGRELLESINEMDSSFILPEALKKGDK